MAKFTFKSSKKSKEDEEEKRKQDLYTLAKKEGIAGPEQKKQSPKMLERVFDVLSRGQYAFTSGIIQGAKEQKAAGGKNVLKYYPGWAKGVISGLTGKTKTNTEDVLKEYGVAEKKLFTTPKFKTPNIPGVGEFTVGGNVTTRGLAALPGDIFLDPTTYLSFGAGKGAKLALKEGTEVTLNTGAGQTLLVSTKKKLQKQLVKEGKEVDGLQLDQLTRQEVSEIVSKNPNKYVDFGGVKFGGKTIAPQAQRAVGGAVAATGAPRLARRGFAAVTSPVNKGARLMAAGYDDFYEQYQNVLRAPKNIKNRAVQETIEKFEAAYDGKRPTQQQLDEIWTLADQGLPINVEDFKPEPFELGITSFRGTPVAKLAETDPYFKTTRSKGFVNSLYQNADEFTVSLDDLDESAGVWQGSMEPSFKIAGEADPAAARAYAAQHGLQANQDAVAYFSPNSTGAGTKYVFSNIGDPDTVISQLKDYGIDGATYNKNTGVLEILDLDGSLNSSAATLGKSLKSKPEIIKGTVDFIEKGNYEQVIKDYKEGPLRGATSQRNRGAVSTVEGPTGPQFSKPQTPILTEVGQDLPEDFVAKIDALDVDEGTKTLYKDYLRNVRPELRQLSLDLGLDEKRLIDDYIFRGVKEKTKESLKISNPLRKQTPAQLKKRTAEAFTGAKQDPIWAIAQSLASLRTASVNNQFLQETLQRYGIKAKKGMNVVPDGYVEFKPQGALGFFPVETKGGKIVAGVTKNTPTYFLPEEIGKAMTKFTNPKDINKFLNVYDKLLGVYKIGLTSYYPAFHIRNFIGNVFNNWIGGVTNPKDYTDAALLQSGTLKGKIAGYTQKELKTAAEDLGVVGTGFYQADVAQLLEEVSKGKPLASNVKSKTGKVINIPTVLGSTIEDNAKLAHFVSKIRSGHSLEEAARSTRKYLFDYSELTDFEKGVLKRIFPFYTWTRKNVPLQLEQMVRQPGKYSVLGDVINALPKGEQGEIDLLPDYIKEGLFVKLGGSGDNVNYGYGVNLLPVEDINRLYRGDIKRTFEREVLSFANPLIQFPLKEVAQKDFFYNKPYETYKYDAGKQAKRALQGKPGGDSLLNWLELKEEKFTLKTGKDAGTEVVRYSVNPSKWELLQTTPLSRLLNTLSADSPLNQAISPLKKRSFDLETQAKIKDTTSFKEFEQRLIDAGLLKTFSKTYIPKDDEEEPKKRSKLKFKFR